MPRNSDSFNRRSNNSFWKSAAPPRVASKSIFLATLTSIAGLMILGLITDLTGELLLIPPMAASMALVMGAPSLPLSQPRNVIGGQVLSACVGVATSLDGDTIWHAALAGGLALGAMMLARMPHSPAAATAMIGVTTHTPAALFVCYAGVAATILVIVGTLGHRINKGSYPEYVW